MPEEIIVPLGEKSYPILIDQNFHSLGKSIQESLSPSKVIIISDETVAARYGNQVIESILSARLSPVLIPFPPGESAKSFLQASRLFDQIFLTRADRKTAIVALGGGVTGDLAGFIAATFMRGIPFIQVPTSLLAQVDSSVGGKVAINHPMGKNMIGAFHQPRLVFTNVTTLNSLPDEEFSSGMAEAIKHGIIRDAEYFTLLETKVKEIRALNPDILTKVVSGSCRIKASVVGEDEREQGVRALLNLGHTFGHALESLTDYQGYRHGEAVSIGMMAACRLAEVVLNFPRQDSERIFRVISSYSLPTTFSNLSTDSIITSMFGDKKTENGRLRLILPPRIGSAEVHTVTCLESIRHAIDSVRR